jgi:hypothetical protein
MSLEALSSNPVPQGKKKNVETQEDKEHVCSKECGDGLRIVSLSKEVL